MKKFPIIILLLLLTACANTEPAQTTKSMVSEPMQASAKTSDTIEKRENLINVNGKTVSERIRVPTDFERIKVDKTSFCQYLRDLPVKPDGTKIKLYNGNVTEKDVHVAVLDIDVGNRDLQQCADAVIRLRAEYLYSQGLYKRIHFNFTNGFNADYWKWMNGNRIVVKGNKTYWVKNTKSSNEYSSFRKYLDIVFAYAGTLSLSKEMKKESIENMQIGDVFLKGATPGHTVIILDMAENKVTGEKIFLTAQSYMPAQSIHILKNPENENLSPWYSTNFGNTLKTPEWDFDKSQLMRFEN
ncbi:DUF4846 domain-containing protein [Ruminiclostridium cellulolyticum]|uniref:Lipoprotein n=1 Tax=Ruminiclostridium cellulolyticum (strain ATCC 35319 / DSM 5812 / JCM 6584 / H10) TaxID=394503 RepID=B8I4L8_RUMCH|nr:DUF4846 domain-containing protein [Ruminiclostridium cellulolyticum]ACL74572.1 conserved hypothetical protein [Ruminiclostridium cellulolyticum H10]